MPLTQLRTFCVRHHECDAHGYIHPAVYMRYAQESAFDASAAAGYDMARYEELDRLWLARETEIEYLHPLRYGDSIQIKTWVVDFRQVRSVRAYEFRRVDSDEMVARAFTDWVHLERSTGRPAHISPEMRAAFFPEGPPPPAPPRKRFPTVTAPPSPFRHSRRAEWRDIDAAGHVNNTAYLSYVEDCSLQSLAVQGWPMPRLEAEGLSLATRSHRIEYRQPSLLDDELEISTWISNIRESIVERYTIVTRPADGATISRARTVQAWVDPETRNPTPIPDALRADIAPATAG